MINLEDYVLKYKKKKESSTSKSHRKSKHKHEYIDCLLVDRKRGHPYKTSYCNTCGKIGKFSLFEFIEADGERILASDSDIFEKYKDLDKFFVDDICCAFKVGD